MQTRQQPRRASEMALLERSDPWTAGSHRGYIGPAVRPSATDADVICSWLRRWDAAPLARPARGHGRFPADTTRRLVGCLSAGLVSGAGGAGGVPWTHPRPAASWTRLKRFGRSATRWTRPPLSPRPITAEPSRRSTIAFARSPATRTRSWSARTTGSSTPAIMRPRSLPTSGGRLREAASGVGSCGIAPRTGPSTGWTRRSCRSSMPVGDRASISPSTTTLRPARMPRRSCAARRRWRTWASSPPPSRTKCATPWPAFAPRCR